MPWYAPSPAKASQGQTADKAEGAIRIVRRAQLEHHLLLGAELDALAVLAPAQVPDVELMAVLAEQIGIDATLDHVGRAPFAGNERVMPEVPPEVVGQILRTAVCFPVAFDGEILVVEHEDAARSVAAG
jgi:hypothetical protein